jgi:hypothetical protein
MGNLISCMECPFHEVISDPDPTDWFCDDDVAVVCREMANDKRKEESKYCSDMNQYKCITVSCRPYKTRKETPIPKWCPKGLYNG